MTQQALFLGRPVFSLQTMLRVLATRNPAIPMVVPDGIYGENTMRSVTALQRERNLPATGVVDLATWEAVTQAFAQALPELMPPQPLRITLNPEQIIRAGEQNAHLFLVQAMFHVLSGSYTGAPDPPATGVLDEQTGAAVLWLQGLAGLPPTGEIGRSEWRVLTGVYHMCAGDGTGMAQTAQQ